MSRRIRRLFGNHKLWVRAGCYVIAGALLFALGAGVGDGRIHVGPTSKVQSDNPGLPAQLDYSSVSQLYASLRQNYNGKLTTGQLLDGLKHGLAAAANDPYTVYFTAQEAKDFSDQLNRSFSGI